MVVGVSYLVYLYVRDPRRVTEVGLVHIDAPELETAPGPGRLRSLELAQVLAST